MKTKYTHMEMKFFTERLPEYIDALQDIIKLSQGCILLLHLKQHLKETYGFTDRYLHVFLIFESDF